MADISDLPAPKKSDISDLPAPKRTETPTLGSEFVRTGKKAGALAYGLGTSLAGSLGDIESMLPGGSQVGVTGKGALKGYETVFPTTENIQAGLTKMGVAPSPEFSGYQRAGELAPLIGLGGKALYEIGKYGAGKIGSMMSGGKDLAEELRKTTAGRVSEEAAQAGKKAETAESRAAAAQRIAEREAGKPAQTFAQMPGVTLRTEAGITKPIPQTLDEIGSTIKSEADKVYEGLRKTRADNAERLKGEAFSAALNKEKAGQTVADTEAFKEAMKKINAEIVNPDTKLTVASVDAIKNQLLQIKRAMNPREVDPATGIVRGKPVSFEGLENLRRFLTDRASGLPAEGFDAISQQQAGRLAKVVEDVMSDFSDGKIRKFIDQYRKDSEPMRVFQTKVGKALVDEQLVGKGVNYAQVPAQSIPGKAFKSKEDYNALVDALGGNKQLADQQAQKYFISQLEGKDSKQIESFIKSNRTMLNETNSIKLAEKLAIDARVAEMRGARAKEMGETRTATAKEQRALEQQLNILNSDIARARDVKEISKKVEDVANTLQKAGRMTVEQRDQVLRNINAIEDLDKKRRAIQQVIKWGLGGGTAYGAYSGTSSYLGL